MHVDPTYAKKVSAGVSLETSALRLQNFMEQFKYLPAYIFKYDSYTLHRYNSLKFNRFSTNCTFSFNFILVPMFLQYLYNNSCCIGLFKGYLRHDIRVCKPWACYIPLNFSSVAFIQRLQMKIELPTYLDCKQVATIRNNITLVI